jgi:thymidylate kinase
MIVLCEGPRGAGKSHLVDNFFAQNEDDRFVYYKWNFAAWVESLNIKEDNKAVHYFSLANILTILEMGNTTFKDKILILDRSIFSAYVWAIYRKRLLKFDLIKEFNKILSSPIYTSCNLVYVNRDESVTEHNRGKKDIFDKYENYRLEKQQFDELFAIFNCEINRQERENSTVIFNNRFDIKSQSEFNKLLNNLVDK